MEKSDILKINKGGNIVSITPYTQTHIWNMIQDWLQRIPTLLFLFILTTFICYHIHLPRRADMDINFSEYGRK